MNEVAAAAASAASRLISRVEGTRLRLQLSPLPAGLGETEIQLDGDELDLVVRGWSGRALAALRVLTLSRRRDPPRVVALSALPSPASGAAPLYVELETRLPGGGLRWTMDLQAMRSGHASDRVRSLVRRVRLRGHRLTPAGEGLERIQLDSTSPLEHEEACDLTLALLDHYPKLLALAASEPPPLEPQTCATQRRWREALRDHLQTGSAIGRIRGPQVNGRLLAHELVPDVPRRSGVNPVVPAARCPLALASMGAPPD